MKKFFIAVSVVIFVWCLNSYRDSIWYYNEPFAEGRGVVFYDQFRTQPGYTLVEVYSIPWGRPRCRIMDLKGKVVLTLPGINCELLEDGGYISNIDDVVTRYDKHLAVRWSLPNLVVRHDIYENLQKNETLLWIDVPMKVNRDMPFANSQQLEGKSLVVNELRGYNAKGELSFRWNAFEHLEDLQEIKSNKNTLLHLTEEYMDRYEFSHFNSIDVIPENSLEEKWPAFKKGNILTSSTTCKCLAIIDRESGRIVWYHRTNDRTHSAHWLKNGNILFYLNTKDNDESNNLFADIIEINPLNHKVVWSYKAKHSGRFWGNYLGASYRLSNGNTLITSLANGGNIFEINSEGRLVWEWNNSKDNAIFPGSIYRARRVDQAKVDALLSVPRPIMDSGVADPFLEP